MSGLSPELNSKRLEVLKDAIPKLPELDFCGAWAPAYHHNSN